MINPTAIELQRVRVRFELWTLVSETWESTDARVALLHATDRYVRARKQYSLKASSEVAVAGLIVTTINYTADDGETQQRLHIASPPFITNHVTNHS